LFFNPIFLNQAEFKSHSGQKDANHQIANKIQGGMSELKAQFFSPIFIFTPPPRDVDQNLAVDSHRRRGSSCGAARGQFFLLSRELSLGSSKIVFDFCSVMLLRSKNRQMSTNQVFLNHKNNTYNQLFDLKSTLLSNIDYLSLKT